MPVVGSRPGTHVEVLVIGGGQTGLATGYHLSWLGADYVIVDAGRRIGDTWRSRWDSLTLFTPARIDGLPGMRYPAEPGSTVTKDQMADFLESYGTRFGLPVRLETRVAILSREGARFVTDVGITADQVVVATGAHGTPYVPAFASSLDPVITQLHSTEYRSPSQLRGDVLVVGAGNSGAEIALDVAGAGLRVWLSGRYTGKVPYTIRYQRPLWWILTRPALRHFLMTDRGQPLVRVGPKDIAAAGIERLPRVAGMQGGRPRLEDGRVLEVGSVIWCTGFRETYSWIRLPILDGTGHIAHQRGVVTSVPGLYFVGLRGQSSIRSSLVDGAGEDAKHVVGRIAARRAIKAPPS